MMFDGESISAYGIEKAFDWYEIPEKNRWWFAQKIITYFSTCKEFNYKKLSKMRNNDGNRQPKPKIKPNS